MENEISGLSELIDTKFSEVLIMWKDTLQCISDQAIQTEELLNEDLKKVRKELQLSKEKLDQLIKAKNELKSQIFFQKKWLQTGPDSTNFLNKTIENSESEFEYSDEDLKEILGLYLKITGIVWNYDDDSPISGNFLSAKKSFSFQFFQVPNFYTVNHLWDLIEKV